MAKIFVSITAQHNIDGSTIPFLMKWADGRVFSIDRIIYVRQAPSLKGGGLEMRYNCRICNKEICFFDELGKWFIEE